MLNFFIGVSRFGQLCENWEYDKSEDLSYEEILKLNFTHLILENNEGTVMKFTENYRNIGVVPQYSHIKIGKVRVASPINDFLEPLPPAIQFKEALVILERRDFVDKIPKDQVYENNWIREDL